MRENEWGLNGYGSMTKEFFDREMYEAWTWEALADLPNVQGQGIIDQIWTIHRYIDRIIYMHDVLDVGPNSFDRIAWSIAVQRNNEIHVDDLFVKPMYRGKGYSQRLFHRLKTLQQSLGLPLRFWIPFADVESRDGLLRIQKIMNQQGLSLVPSPRYSAACCAVVGKQIDDIPTIQLPPKVGSFRTRKHSGAEAKIVFQLTKWSEIQNPAPKVFGADIGCYLTGSGKAVGIDVAVFDPYLISGQAADEKYIRGTPILAVEILSPSDQHGKKEEKINAYLDAGVPLVWEVNPDARTITVRTKDAAPKLISGNELVLGGTFLPGFSVRINEMFE